MIESFLDWVNADEYVFLMMAYLSCCILTNLISNAAAALLCWNIFVRVAKYEGFPLIRVAAMLMIGASSAFLSPVGYQTNLFVQKAATDLKNVEFLKIGLPLVFVTALICPLAAIHLL